MGLKKIFSPSSRSTGSYTPVSAGDKNSEEIPPKNDSPPPSAPAPTEILKNGHHPAATHPEDNWDLMECENVEKFSRAFLTKAQSEYKKKIVVDQPDQDDEGGHKPAPFCGTAGKRRSNKIALQILNKHLEREVKLLKRNSANPSTFLPPSDTERFDRFFIQCAVDIFYIYEHQLRHIVQLGALQKPNCGGGAGGSDAKNNENHHEPQKLQALQAVAEFTARICFAKFCQKKMENFSKQEILFKTLTQCDATTKKAAILNNKKEVHREAKSNKKLSKICLDDGAEEKEKKEEKAPKKTKTKKEKGVKKETENETTTPESVPMEPKSKETKKKTKEVKEKPKKIRHHQHQDHQENHHHGHHAGRGGNFKFFADTLPAFYCPSSRSLLVQEKDCKKLLRGGTEPGDIALKLRKPFKLEWDQIQRGQGQNGRGGDLKAIDHLVDGSEEELKKFNWTDRSQSVGRIYLANLLAIANGNSEDDGSDDCKNEEDAEIKKRFKEAFIKLDRDVDQTQGVIREMEAKLQSRAD